MKQRGHSCLLTFQIPEMRVTHSDIFWCWGNTVILSNFLLNFWGSTFQTSGSQDDAELEGFQQCESFNTSPDCCWCLRRLKIQNAKYRNVCLGRSIAKQAFALPRRPQFWSEAEGADWASMLLFVCSSEILLGATAIDTKMEQHLFMFNWFRDHERLLMPFLVMRAVECWSWLWRPDMFAKVHVFHGMKHEAWSQIKSQGGWHRAEPHGSQPCCSLWSLLESCQRSAGKSLSVLRYSPFKCIE